MSRDYFLGILSGIFIVFALYSISNIMEDNNIPVVTFEEHRAINLECTAFCDLQLPSKREKCFTTCVEQRTPEARRRDDFLQESAGRLNHMTKKRYQKAATKHLHNILTQRAAASLHPVRVPKAAKCPNMCDMSKDGYMACVDGCVEAKGALTPAQLRTLQTEALLEVNHILDKKMEAINVH